jgi:hypothetical protein
MKEQQLRYVTPKRCAQFKHSVYPISQLWRWRSLLKALRAWI